jgi:assimilatory nitrate reductase catalytic subunit
VLFRRIEDARAKRPDMKLIVVDPAPDRHRRGRRSAPGDPARHRHCALQRHAARAALGRPGDLAYIRAHTEGFDALKALVRDYTPAHGGRAFAASGPRTS